MLLSKKHFKVYMFIILAIVFSFSLLFTNNPTKAAEKKKAIIVVIDKVTLADLNNGQYPTIKKLLNNGTVGLMNTNTAGDNNPASTYLTIGSGNRLSAPYGYLAFNSDEYFEGTTAGEIFKRRSGMNPPENGVLHTGIAPITVENKTLNYESQPGFLGKALHQNGFKTAVLGNADTDVEEKRQIVNIAMDDNGIVDYGDVSNNILLRDPNAIMGKRTDYKKIFNEFINLKEKADLIAIEMGDTSRIEAAQNYAFNNVIASEKMDAIERADQFLAQALKQLDLNRDLLIIVTPTPSWEAYNAKNTLTPVIIAGPGFKSGTATSGTTKRVGIVANTDITSTVLNYFNIAQPAFLNGQPIISKANTNNNSVNGLITENQRIVFNFSNRPFILSSYRNVVIISVLLAFIAIIYRFKNLYVIKPILLVSMAFPLAILLLPLLPQISLIVSIIEITVILFFIIWITMYLGRKSTLVPTIIICLLTAILLDIDVVLGSPLIKYSALGFDPMSGARYYGIGNEYMGVLIGSLIIGASALITYIPKYQRLLKVLMSIIFLISIYIMAAPTLGSKAGGIIVALAGFGITFLLWYNVPFNKRNITIAILGLLVVIALFVGLDAMRQSNAQSHFGRSIILIKEGGLKEIVNIIVRKETVNITLITKTQWTWLYIINLIIAIVILYWSKFKIISKKFPLIKKGVQGLIAGSIIALIFNDSGVVAAATMIPFATVFLLLLAVEYKNRYVSK